MNRSAPESVTIVTTPEDHRIARLTAAAIGLSLIDSAIPLPLPGVKPGLANIVTLIVLARYGWGTAAWVSGLRVVAAAAGQQGQHAQDRCPCPHRHASPD